MGLYGDRILPHVINVVMDNKELRKIRARVCADLKGDVVEIGFGTGHNLPFVPSSVTRLRAVEPSALGVSLARNRIESSPTPVEVVGLDGQKLPLADDSADMALCTWTMCTIPDPGAALREVKRVLRPGGELAFVEHGRAPDERVRLWQDRFNGFQQRLAGGCNLNRDIPGVLEAAGFAISRLDTYYGKGQPKPWGATYEGVAVAR